MTDLSHTYVCGAGELPYLTDADRDNDDLNICCAGAAMMGADSCTCWRPVYQLQQREIEPGAVATRTSMCEDCAYRPLSPEMQRDPLYVGSPEFLAEIAEDGHPFWCHQGMRRPLEFRHPDGRVRKARSDGYEPPIKEGTPFKACGEPADICAGWAAHVKATAPQIAEFDVVTPGCLEVLSVGKGDLKLTVGGDDPEDTEKARKLIEEMIRKGYAIFVETDDGLVRVKRFNPKRMSYVITEIVEDAEAAASPPTKKGPTKRKTRERHVPVGGSKATAIGRTSGG